MIALCIAVEKQRQAIEYYKNGQKLLQDASRLLAEADAANAENIELLERGTTLTEEFFGEED